MELPLVFTGSIPALVTPFRDGRVDEKALQSLVEWQIAEGSSGLVPCGTTGESPTLSHEEHRRVVELVIEAAAGRVPVIAGPGSNSTDEAIELSQHAEKAGADALLIVSPYYNRPSQEGIYQHFRHIDAQVGIPIIVYNIPPRLCAEFQAACLAGDFRQALALQDRLMPLHRAMFLEPNPAGPKWGLERLGRIEGGVRLPLVPLTPAAQAEMESAMVHAGLIGDTGGARAEAA
jgi:4-hydroxy-tetrahydrodipicolinate synthase